MYCCNSCKHEFVTTRTFDDTEGDESYDVCPKCGSDDFDIIPDQND